VVELSFLYLISSGTALAVATMATMIQRVIVLKLLSSTTTLAFVSHQLPARQSSLIQASSIDTSFSRPPFSNKITFGAELLIDETILSVDADELQSFVSDPANVLGAAWPKDLIEKRPGDIYRLKQEPLNFANLVTIDNFVDVQVFAEPKGGIRMKSTSIESFASFGPTVRERVDVNLDLGGSLTPISKTGANDARIRGRVQFTASGDLIGPLIFSPTPVLEGATGVINRGVLEYARREFIKGIESSFRQWSKEKAQAPPTPAAPPQLR
jgi:hypothetical protein